MEAVIIIFRGVYVAKTRPDSPGLIYLPLPSPSHRHASRPNMTFAWDIGDVPSGLEQGQIHTRDAFQNVERIISSNTAYYVKAKHMMYMFSLNVWSFQMEKTETSKINMTLVGSSCCLLSFRVWILNHNLTAKAN